MSGGRGKGGWLNLERAGLSHVTQEEPEDQRGQATCPKSHSEKAKEAGFQLRGTPPASLPGFYLHPSEPQDAGGGVEDALWAGGPKSEVLVLALPGRGTWSLLKAASPTVTQW